MPEMNRYLVALLATVCIAVPAQAKVCRDSHGRFVK
jgi:hypothetical protein